MKTKAKIVKIFFTKVHLMKALGGYQWSVLTQFGALVRAISRRSMRKGRYIVRNGLPHPKPSPPGSPPRVWEGTLKKLIYYKVRPLERDVLIGPERDFRKRKVGAFVVPQLHEFGGFGKVRLVIGGKYTNRVVNGKFPSRPYMRPAFKKGMLALRSIMISARKHFK